MEAGKWGELVWSHSHNTTSLFPSLAFPTHLPRVLSPPQTSQHDAKAHSNATRIRCRKRIFTKLAESLATACRDAQQDAAELRLA